MSRHRSSVGLRWPSKRIAALHRLPIRSVLAARCALRCAPMAARSLRHLIGDATPVSRHPKAHPRYSKVQCAVCHRRERRWQHPRRAAVKNDARMPTTGSPPTPAQRKDCTPNDRPGPLPARPQSAQTLKLRVASRAGSGGAGGVRLMFSMCPFLISRLFHAR
ncbi:hypothetical protein [Verminephrobacter eiseniae]|uniref:hypothetical protein n=1 Tax=Verminephrobacter eiseniae TaxID=364317 RepID=UPI0012ED3EE4|nr:hypothetical protein [Verminephrobacter eiseniae]MCW5283415.1 hypothetical protein [Verminephrobacter eiseniae]MCW5301124.1 hypothetical protein [Verminephrobacter eiseniae]MCW8190234.1 hypothetical protein [Verminephrobacter eiseniae]